MAQKWSGPHHILRLKGEANPELLLKHNNKKLMVYVNHLKPYFIAAKNILTSPDFFPTNEPAIKSPRTVQLSKSPAENYQHDIPTYDYFPTVPTSNFLPQVPLQTLTTYAAVARPAILKQT